MLAVLALSATTAAAETLSIQVSPSSTIGDQPVQITASGSASAGDTFKVIEVSPNNGGSTSSCPTTPPEYDETDVELIGGGDALPTTLTSYAPNSRGLYRLCGYLQHTGSQLATAETSLTVTASSREAEKAAQEKATAEANTAARSEAEAAERKARYEAEAPARLAAEKAKAKAEAEKRAHETPLTHLSVSLETVHGKSSSYPGDTLIYVAVAAYAHVTIKLVHGKHHRTVHYEEVGTANGAPGPTLVIWSCSNAGGEYSYTVTARSDVGPTLTRRGHFKAVTVTRCAALRRQEQEARQRDIRKYEEEVNRSEREQREAVEREAYNCRAEGGTPITLHTSEGNVPACRAPNGGLLPVPDLLAKSATAGAQEHKSRAVFSQTQPSPWGRAASPIYFFRLAGVLQEPRVRPSEIVFAADGNWAVTGLHWHGWGTGVARSDGTSRVNDCIPNCAQGTIALVPAHVTLSNPGRYRGREMYRCYSLDYTVKTSAPAERGCL